MRELWRMTAGRPAWRRIWFVARVVCVALGRTAAQALAGLRPIVRAALALALAAAFAVGGYALGVRDAIQETGDVPAFAEADGQSDGQPDGTAEPDVTLYYDDRWTPDSAVTALGDNTPDNALDGAILTAEGDGYAATGTGETVVTLASGPVTVRVLPAPISLLLLIGQSNMEGNEGEPPLSAAGPAGQVYSTYGPSSVKLAGVVGGNGDIPLLSMSTADSLVAAALTGPRSRVSRTGDALLYPLDALTAGGGGKGGPDSGLAWGWQRATGEKVWVVNAAHSGSPIADWQPGAADFRAAVALFTGAQHTLIEEVAAGHYTLSHMGYFWLQGCSDKNMSAAEYRAQYRRMHGGLCAALRCALGTVEFGGILMVQANDGTDGFMTWRELAMDGPRTAQYQMGASLTGEDADVYVVSTIMEDWVYDEDGGNGGVERYFLGKYGETLTYPLQNGATGLAVPRTPADVKDSIHYNQVGYNEIGFDAAENMAEILRTRAD